MYPRYSLSNIACVSPCDILSAAVSLLISTSLSISISRSSQSLQSFLPTDPLSCVKFVCKELWHALFGKQVDKLQTNYRGMYVLHEACFPWLQRLPTADKALYEAYARPHAALVVGLVRGALAALGLAADARLELDLSQPRPVCLFVVNDVVAAANNNTTAGAGASAGAGAGNQGAGRTGAGGR